MLEFIGKNIKWYGSPIVGFFIGLLIIFIVLSNVVALPAILGALFGMGSVIIGIVITEIIYRKFWA